MSRESCGLGWYGLSVNAPKLAALCALMLLLACDPDDGDDTGADTSMTTGGTMADGGDAPGDAGESAGEDSTGDTPTGMPVDDPRAHCELPTSAPQLGACGDDVCFEYHGGSPGCVADQDECPVERTGMVLTGICDQQSGGEVFLFYWVADTLSDPEILDLRDDHREECEALPGVWCDTFL